jgi:hypothetical protein
MRTVTITGNTSILRADYFPPIVLNEDYVCGLISLDTYHTIPNVETENNLFHIGANVIEIPIGSYELTDIAKLISDEYEQYNKGVVEIKANYNTLHTEIKSSTENIYFDKERTIGSLLGFSKRVLYPEKQEQSDDPIKITNLNSIMVECNIISGSYINNQSAHIIHQFSINVSPGYKINETPSNVIYLPVNVKQINSIVLRIVDQDCKLINFRGETITIRLHLKPARE